MSTYTVHQLAKLAGVSVRTLHYYDQIGLLKPSHLQSNGYRSYQENEVLRLQQILFFRELDFPLADIQRIMASPTYAYVSALRDQKKLLELKKDRLDQLIKTINTTIKHMTNDTTFEDAHKLAGLDDKTIAEYKEEVYKKYDPKLVQQSMQRVKKMGKSGMQKVLAEAQDITLELAQHMDEDPASETVQTLVGKHHQWINHFYDCNVEIYRGLSNLYIQDPRFTKNYDKVKPGLAQFLHDAMNIYCDHLTAQRAS